MKTNCLICVIVIIFCVACNPWNEPQVAIVMDSKAEFKEQLAAKELQRYLYLLTDTLPKIKKNTDSEVNTKNKIFIGNKNQEFIKKLALKWNIEDKLQTLNKQEYLIKSVSSRNGSDVLIIGGDSQGTLYGAYDFLEEQGIWFDIYSDIIPDEKQSCSFSNLDKIGRPVFEKRGLQPFHDFPEGPDYWDYDTYQAVISQLPKMRMNFLGFHTYPEGWVNGQAEPTVWIGLPEDSNNDGTVDYSYPSTFANTSRKHLPPLTGQLPWYYAPMATSDFVAGASLLFDEDAYGADFLNGQFPMPDTPEAMNEVFNNTGEMLKGAFSLAKKLGVETAIGTEIPLTIPIRVKQRMKEMGLDPESEEGLKALYKGIFMRIESMHPLDYYWFWTSESWLWEGHADQQQDEAIRQLKFVRDVWDEMKPDFNLATCGWTLGPPKAPTAFQEILPENSAMASINLSLGFSPVSHDFANVQSVNTWAIPWLEDDPALCNPQLWAGRVRRDAADALKYGSEGLMGIHWRTRELSPQFGALARAGWDHTGWNPYLTDKEFATKKSSGLPRDLPIVDFYQDWCSAMFGNSVSDKLVEIFTSLDGGSGEVRKSKIPRPTDWDLGPGGVQITVKSQLELDSTFAFIGRMEDVRPRITGSGNLERFDFWLKSFKCARDIARQGLFRYQLDLSINKLNELNEHPQKTDFVKNTIIPIRIAMSRNWETLITHQIERASAYDVIGTICNLEQHSRNSKEFLKAHDSLISVVLNEKLPAEIELSKEYEGSPRIIMPTVRTLAKTGEALNLKVILLDKKPPVKAVLKQRVLGSGKYQEIPLLHVARGVYSVQLLPIVENGLEYFIEVDWASGQQMTWPVTAPSICQTVITY